MWQFNNDANYYLRVCKIYLSKIIQEGKKKEIHSRDITGKLWFL